MMFFKKLFLFSKQDRNSTDDFVGISFPWDDVIGYGKYNDVYHKLISTYTEKNYKQFYLFNFVKIWQTKN